MISKKRNTVELVAGIFLLLFCAATALTQPVNPFPEDGWFFSRSRIFEHRPGADNYTPIAIPAYFYAGTYAIRIAAGWNLETEFYFASLLHHLLLFGTGVLAYLSHRILGFRTLGIMSSATLVVFMESTLIPQAFWSENLTVWLMSAVLFVGLLLFQAPRIPNRRFGLLTILFGLLLAGLVVTRVVPILILPGMIMLLRTRLTGQLVVQFALITSTLVIVVALAAMSANLYRYGRFELSDSTGRHLWNVVSPNANVVLADSHEYQLLRKAIPDAQGQEWWELDEPEFGPDLAHFTREKLMRKMVMHAIVQHPFLFVKQGVINLRILLLRCPARLGLHRSGANPLNRDGSLPPLLGSFPALDRTLAGVHRFVNWVYKSFVCGTLAGALLALFLCRKAKSGATLLFFGYVFLAGLYVCGQIEEPDGRYVLLYFPALALLTSNTLAILASAAQSDRKP